MCINYFISKINEYYNYYIRTQKYYEVSQTVDVEMENEHLLKKFKSNDSTSDSEEEEEDTYSKYLKDIGQNSMSDTINTFSSDFKPYDDDDETNYY